MNIREYIYEVFALDDFEKYCVEQAFLRELGANGVHGDGKSGEGRKFKLHKDADYLTVGEAVAGFGEDVASEQLWQYFTPDASLMRYFFKRDEKALFVCRRLRLDRRMLDMLMGDTRREGDRRGGLKLVWPEDEKSPNAPSNTEEGDKNVAEQLERLVESRKPEEPTLIGLVGPKGVGRRFVVRRFYSSQKQPLLMADAACFTGNEAEDEAVADAIARECLFYQAGLMIYHFERAGNMDPERAEIYGDNAKAVMRPVFRRLFEVLPVIFAGSDKKYYFYETVDGFSSVWMETSLPDYNRGADLWRDAVAFYGVEEDVNLEEMPAKFILTPGQILKAAEIAAGIAMLHGRNRISTVDLNEACHELLAGVMGKKVMRIRSDYEWDDLVLPAFQKDQLRTACDQIRYKNRVYGDWGFKVGAAYGKGVSMIFCGLPGTGKTMGAQVMASELGMDLYKVELAAVVSKYIGETEKNLEEIFEQARLSQAILFFDEADVLFSKRTEVRSSNDKYSNMEAAYMLQKIEGFDGITILSTNYMQNFDEAFKRRMKQIVEFPFPDYENRKLIWKKVFPEGFPVESNVDYDYLAWQFEFSGSNIRNAALHASFLAAAREENVGMADLIAGVLNESRKTGKILQPQDLGEYYMMFGGETND